MFGGVWCVWCVRVDGARKTPQKSEEKPAHRRSTTHSENCLPSRAEKCTRRPNGLSAVFCSENRSEKRGKQPNSTHVQRHVRLTWTPRAAPLLGMISSRVFLSNFFSTTWCICSCEEQSHPTRTLRSMNVSDGSRAQHAEWK